MFTTKYKCHYLVYFEDFNRFENAIAREKQLKNWQRKWKIELIRKENPELIDLAKDGIRTKTIQRLTGLDRVFFSKFCSREKCRAKPGMTFF